MNQVNLQGFRKSTSPPLKILLAVAAFAVLHSLLASRPAKELAARLLGLRRRNAYYRIFFNTQSLVTSGALVIYIWRQPDRLLWQLSKPWHLLFNFVRLLSLYGIYQAAHQIGISRLSGLQSLAAHLKDDPIVPPEPEAQGPALDRPLNRPFRFSRHPLNFLALPLIWLTPRLTRNRLLFNAFASLYFFIGSLHEEKRMRQSWGQAYEKYRERTRFLLGRKSLSATKQLPPSPAPLHS